MDNWSTLTNILGSPVFQGIGVAVALFGALFTALFFFFPAFKTAVQHAGHRVLHSRYFGYVFGGVVLFLTGAGTVLFTGVELPKMGVDATWPPESGILAAVENRGKLRCGVHGGLPRFSQITDAGNTTGFDADFCRVIAVAIFGEYESRVDFVRLNVEDRFSALEEGKVDVLVRNTTWTVGRDVTQNLDFGPPIFYDGQAFLVRDASGIEELADLRDKEICVLPNTTTIQNLLAVFEERGIKFRAVTKEEDGTPFESNENVFGAYALGRCDAVTSDQSQLIARQPDLSNPSEHDFIRDDEGVVVISKEPLAPLFVSGDEQWREVITYAVYATIQAAELDIHRENILMKRNVPEVPIKAFLGIDDSDIQEHIGQSIGLPNDFALKIVERVGNYDEIYQRNLGDLIPERGPNQTWTKGGLLISPPFNSAPPRVVSSQTP
ncbi:MAG: amino acid ABC transporter substrate-binding protein [Ardenticatenaceae bacterium]